MRLMLETNVVLDVLLARRPFYAASYDVLKLAAAEEAECLLSASAVTDLFYILRKALQDAQKARAAIEDLMKLVIIADVTAEDVADAVASNMPDFEDALLACVAKRCQADAIVTRNQKDFALSPVPVLSPEQVKTP